jgi:hypothetical protein
MLKMRYEYALLFLEDYGFFTGGEAVVHLLLLPGFSTSSHFRHRKKRLANQRKVAGGWRLEVGGSGILLL